MASCASCGKTIFGGRQEKGQVFCNKFCSSQYQDSVTCGKCGTINPLDGQKCTECGEYLHQFKGHSQGGATPGKKSMGCLGGCATLFVVLIVLGVIGSLVNPTDRVSQNVASSVQEQAVEPEETETEDDGMTGSQRNAVRSAKQYLDVQPFSRDGLIQQLSAEAGSGYDITDATVAVDSLNVDWNQEAVKSAKQYLSIQGFSCNGLIEQLSASAGSKFTVSQATYGAQQAGACN